MSEVDTQHLLWKMEDHQEMAQKQAEAKVSDWSSSRGKISGSGLPYGLPVTLPGLAAEGSLAKTLDLPPTAPKQGKRGHADDDEITEIPVEDEPVEPPKKKKKKKDKDRSKEEVPDPVIPDDRVAPRYFLGQAGGSHRAQTGNRPVRRSGRGGRTAQKEEKEEETEETGGTKETERRSGPREVPGTGTRSQSQGNG